MEKLSKSQKGFTLVEGLLILLVVGVIGGIGWFVYDRNKPSERTKQVTAINQASVTSDFIQYESKELGFKFSYPKVWGEIKTDFNKQNIIENAKDSFWYASFSNDKNSIYIKGASQNYSNSHGVDDIIYTSGFTDKDTANLPNCFGPDLSGDKGTCQLVGTGKFVLVGFFNEWPNTGYPLENGYIVLNLKPNNYNIHAIRISYFLRGDSKVKVTKDQFLDVAKTLQSL